MSGFHEAGLPQTRLATNAWIVVGGEERGNGGMGEEEGMGSSKRCRGEALST